MTDYRKFFDKDLIGSWDLDDSKDVVVTITKVEGGTLTGFGGRKSKKPIVYMRGTEKGFAVNATNGKTISAMYGNHVEQWVGKKIALYKSSTRNPNGDGDIDCIRVRPKIPEGKPQAHDDAIAPPPPSAAADSGLGEGGQI